MDLLNETLPDTKISGTLDHEQRTILDKIINV